MRGDKERSRKEEPVACGGSPRCANWRGLPPGELRTDKGDKRRIITIVQTRLIASLLLPY
ncbi:hypothetical protein A6770_19705 [Nostoc minutum NIES-26]|uniref:Uncharacterized protein n=1 Tax=Nostoc minutum NIES-26 TaxID=1844469 RepID=A0A367R7V2_9NOSO|nr:hypothetical protein A6770_19705 [Nostoc minutum NIES-26]